MKNTAYSMSHRMITIASFLALWSALGADDAVAHTCTNMMTIGLSKDQVNGQPIKNPIGITKDYNNNWETVAGRMFTNHFRYENLKSLSEPDRIVVEQKMIDGGSIARSDDGISSSASLYQVVFGYLKDGEIIKDKDEYHVYYIFKCF